MSKCADCGMRTAPGRRVCKTCSIEDRHGVPSDHFGDAGDGVHCWVQDLSEDWHASMYFEDSRHVAACGEVLDTPVADVKDDPRFFDAADTCDACEQALQEDDEKAVVPDGGEFERASEIATDGGLEIVLQCAVDGCETDVAGLSDGREVSYRDGVVCNDCIRYHDRHLHFPDDDEDYCVECEIDAGKVRHRCDSVEFDSVVINPGERCPHCQNVVKNPVTDGGLEEVYRREVIVATDDGVAIGEAAVPKGGRDG